MIAVWYHCKLSGTGIPSPSASMSIMREQMKALKKSGLADAADQIHVGVNGPQCDAVIAALLVPGKSVLHLHGDGARSELPTFAVLRAWLPSHADWLVLYHHSKGVTQPQDAFHHHHRRVMERAVVWNWRKCVRDLENGYDAVGVNLVDPITRPVLPGRFFAGNFWWSKASYLLELPVLPASITQWSTAQRCLAEGWIGRCPRKAIMMDYERPELYRLP